MADNTQNDCPALALASGSDTEHAGHAKAHASSKSTIKNTDINVIL